MPKPFVRKMPATWWCQKSAYVYFMLRELTAVPVAAYCVFLLVLAWKVKQGGSAFDDLMDLMHSNLGWTVGLHFVALAAVMYHTMTWFELVPKVLVFWRGEEKLPPIALVLAHWVLWLIVTALLVCIVCVVGFK